MNTQTCENEYPDIALITVARYAGIDVLEVLSTLGLDLRESRSKPSVNVTSFAIRHKRALYTIAKFSGLDKTLVEQRLDHSRLTRHDVDTLHMDMAA